MPHEILFSLLDEMQNTIKMNTRESKERKFETKVREIRRVVLIFILLYLLFCLAPKKKVDVKSFFICLNILGVTAAIFTK